MANGVGHMILRIDLASMSLTLSSECRFTKPDAQSPVGENWPNDGFIIVNNVLATRSILAKVITNPWSDHSPI